MIKLTFEKRPGKCDRMRIEGKGTVLALDCPKSGRIPHDLVNYAVEASFPLRGALTLAGSGIRYAGSTHAGDGEAAVADSLTETFEAELQGGRVGVDDFIALAAISCRARGVAPRPIDPQAVENCRRRLRALETRWRALPEGGQLVLTLG